MKMKKYIAPILIAALLVLYYGGIALFFAAFAELSPTARILLITVTLALAGVAIYVLVQRIREIQSGEEDDLDQY